jgi:cytochrome P450
VKPFDAIPDFEETAQRLGTIGFSEDFAEFYSTGERLLRAGAKRVIVFRSEDLRRVAAHPAAGNMPIQIIARRAYLDTNAAPAVRDEDRVNLVRILFNQVFTVNPPLHGPTRQVFARPLAVKCMPDFEPVADRLVAELIEELAGQGEIDFSFQFTERLTARFWGVLLGMTAQEEEQIVELVREMTPFFFIERTDEETILINGATGCYLETVAGAVERSLQVGGNTLLESMAAEFDAIDLPGKPESIGMSIAANLIDGFHTAALAAANATYHLLRNPEALAAVRADPTLAAAAHAEGLRMSSPVIVTHRYALEEFGFAGFQIPAGTAIAMVWAAGNRDPDAFDSPNEYQLTRVRRADATFGGGIHLCPGRNVARMISLAVLRGITQPGIKLALGDDFQWIVRSTMRQPRRMPVTIERS